MRRLLYRLLLRRSPKPKTFRGSVSDTLLEVFRLWP
jgi:hypothetical protein